jgi:micrococcal nuclease
MLFDRTMTLRLIFTFLALFALTPGCDPADPASVDAAVDSAVDAADAEPDPFDHPARVLRVIDGDTLEVNFQGVELRVRFSGIDTPELGPPVEPWAEEARLLTLQNATPATTVGLEFDDEACGIIPFPSACFDMYDRMLVYIRTVQGYDLNAMLIAGGLATVYEQADFSRKVEYQALEAQAQAEGVGIWGP